MADARVYGWVGVNGSWSRRGLRETWPDEKNWMISCLVAVLSLSPHPMILMTRLLLLHSVWERKTECYTPFLSNSKLVKLTLLADANGSLIWLNNITLKLQPDWLNQNTIKSYSTTQLNLRMPNFILSNSAYKHHRKKIIF